MGVLSRVKPRIESALRSLVSRLAGIHGNPDTYTLAGVALSLSAPLAVVLGYPLASPALAGLGAAMDAVDGMVARVSGRAGPRGALLDSVSDRVSDSAYAATLLLLGVDGLLVLAAATGSLVVPYVRAKAEALGVEMAGRGLLERPERTLLYLAAITAAALGHVSLSTVLAVAIAVLAWTTVVQRTLIALREAG